MGRFKAPAIWQPNLATLGKWSDAPIYSPHCGEPWRSQLAEMTKISCADREMTTFDFVVAETQRLAIADAMNREFGGINFRLPREVKNTAKLLGNLYYLLMQISKSLHFAGAFSAHPAYVWAAVILENEASLILNHLADPDEITKRKLIEIEKKRSKELRSLANPFSAPITQPFFDLAIRAAEGRGSQNWRKEYFNPYLSARSQILAYIKKSERDGGAKIYKSKKVH